MSAEKTDDGNVATNKQLVLGMCAQDGSLVSPIDLTLDATKPLQLEPLGWFNFNVPPFKMKLTNSGDTLVISAKWARERPYLTGGPLDGNYVFSQIHFHWGSSEHEGSEHMVRGICYPMEMHVVFFKTRYLTQAAALKQDDGVIILAYLFKLQKRSAPGLHWLASQLENVVEPRTSTQVPPMPLATILVPFDADYFTYWGALVSQNCRHPVNWLVSRAALAVSSEDLNLFRCLLNSKKETMTKNFRATSPAGGRAIFHVNPSSDTANLLLPGAVDPPCQAVIVNYSHIPAAHQTEAKKIFSKGDSNELENKDSLSGKKQEETLQKEASSFSHEGTQKKITTENERVMKHKRKSGRKDSEVSGVVGGLSTSPDKKTKLERQCSTTKPSQERGRKANKTEFQEKKGDCVHVNVSTSYIRAPSKLRNEGKTSNDTQNGNEMKIVKDNKANKGNKSQKSRFPVPKAKAQKGKQGLESCYASYFKRPDSAPVEPVTTETTNIKPATPQPKSKPETPVSEIAARRKTPNTIPRPSTRHGVK